MIGIELRNHLLDCDDIKDKVDNRIRPLKLADTDTMPGIVYQTISNERHYAHDGEIGIDTKRIQISVIHKRADYAEMQDIVKYVKKQMEKFVEQDEIESCFFDDENETYEDESDYIKVNIDYIISYKEE